MDRLLERGAELDMLEEVVRALGTSRGRLVQELGVRDRLRDALDVLLADPWLVDPDPVGGRVLESAALLGGVNRELGDLRLRNPGPSKLLAELLFHESIEVSARLPHVDHAEPIVGRARDVRDLSVAQRVAYGLADLVVLLECSARNVDDQTNSHCALLGRVWSNLFEHAGADAAAP